MISGSTGPIFTKFSTYGRYLIVDYNELAALFLLFKGTQLNSTGNYGCRCQTPLSPQSTSVSHLISQTNVILYTF